MTIMEANKCFLKGQSPTLKKVQLNNDAGCFRIRLNV